MITYFGCQVAGLNEGEFLLCGSIGQNIVYTPCQPRWDSINGVQAAVVRVEAHFASRNWEKVAS